MKNLEQIQHTLEDLQKSIIKHNNERSEDPNRKMISFVCILFEGDPGDDDTLGIVGTGYTEFLIDALTTLRNDLLTESIIEE